MAGKARKMYKKKGKVIKDLTRKVVKAFNDKKTPLNYKQIAAVLNITDTDGRTQILRKLEELKATGKLQEVTKGKYELNKDTNYFVGTLDVTSNGNAYFICDDFEKDVFIPSRNLKTGLHKDKVKVYVYKRKQKGKLEGDVVEIMERFKVQFVGVLQMSRNFGFVVADDNRMYTDLYVDKKDLNGATDGDKVVVEIMDWPTKSRSPFSKITKVLGRPGEHQTEIHSILTDHGLPYEFPPEVEAYASNLPIEISKEEVSKRLDLRDVLTFTIDPKDAKDFDDALSYEVLEDGHVKVGIHIADVSHYLEENTILDDEAYARATSVYLVDRVVPMLPEILSNNVCSLRPQEEKLCFSAMFTLNEKAEVVDQWFGRTVIYSDHRFTYEDAQEVIEGAEHELKDAILSL
ncbi:MAG: ribonuclease R family protein, partial [Flavobacteriaceae bacterium]